MNLDYNGFVVHRYKKARLVSLTDMWKAQGSPPNKQPRDWMRLEATIELLNRISKQMGVTPIRGSKGIIKGIPGVLESKRGGTAPGTYAISELATDYAQILSVEFHQWALTALVERVEEEADPEKALSRGYDRAVRGWKKQGYSDADIDTLAQCVITRKDFTGTLKEHGVAEGKPSWMKDDNAAYAVVTNELYKPLLPGTAKEYRQRHNLPKKTNVREHLTQSGEMTKRAAIMLAETMARETIKTENRYGFSQCSDACGQAGKKVSRVFEP